MIINLYVNFTTGNVVIEVTEVVTSVLTFVKVFDTSVTLF
jgi:hypothetical protein